MQTNIEEALAYARRGFSVIPIKPDIDPVEKKAKKDPYIRWTDFKTRRASEGEIQQWWGRWPKAMVGIVTGEISGLLVIDCDSEDAYRRVQELLPDTLLVPVAKTPRGWHLYFLFPKGSNITVGAGILPGVDFRGEGGYIIAPPSVNGDGKVYEWLDGLSLDEVEPQSAPESIIKKISLYRGCKENVRPDAGPLQFLTQGTRDNDLFHVANCLLKGGCQEDTASQVLDILAKNSTPPFPEKEAQAKITSVLHRCERRERNLTEDLRRWIDLTSAYFSLTEAYEPLQVLTSQKNSVHQIMHRFVKEGYVERHPNKNGVYRRIDREVEFMDFAGADVENYVDLHLPLNLHIKTHIYPKGVIVVAGVSGMGKTLLALNAIHDNMGRFPIFYFNSEMGPEALKKKLSYFPTPIPEWAKHMKVVDGWDFYNIPDKIQPDAFNVIDYLEPEGEKAFNIHGVISAIIRRLNKGTALITVQKKPGATMGTGGVYSIKAATMAVSLEWGKLEIVKNRFREADPMPSLTKINFDVHQGYRFVCRGTWYN